MPLRLSGFRVASLPRLVVLVSLLPLLVGPEQAAFGSNLVEKGTTPGSTPQTGPLCFVDPAAPAGFKTIQAAINEKGCADVVLAPGTYPENVRINRSISIEGSGRASHDVVVDGRGLDSVFIVSGGTVTLSLLTIANGSAPVFGGGIDHTGGTLSLDRVTIAGNRAHGDGGGLYNDSGSVTVTASTLSDNVAERTGGGIANFAELQLGNSTVVGNDAAGEGGGISSFIPAKTWIVNATFASNRTESTSAASGIANHGQTKVSNTVVDGHMGEGQTGSNCVSSGTLIDDGHNLDTDATCGFAGSAGFRGDLNPELGPLRDNGGPTLTIAPAANSPALGTGDPLVCAAAPIDNRDQRGWPRLATSTPASCDVGALQISFTPRPTPAPALLPTATSAASLASTFQSPTPTTFPTQAEFPTTLTLRPTEPAPTATPIGPVGVEPAADHDQTSNPSPSDRAATAATSPILARLRDSTPTLVDTPTSPANIAPTWPTDPGSGGAPPLRTTPPPPPSAPPAPTVPPPPLPTPAPPTLAPTPVPTRGTAPAPPVSTPAPAPPPASTPIPAAPVSTPVPPLPTSAPPPAVTPAPPVPTKDPPPPDPSPAPHPSKRPHRTTDPHDPGAGPPAGRHHRNGLEK